MSGSKNSSKKPVKITEHMHWGQIDAILWDMISQWDGKKKSKEKILSNVSKLFKWSDKQTEKACEMHFNVYNKKKT